MRFPFLSPLLFASILAVSVSAEKRVVIIPVEDEVDYGLLAFLKRSTAEALKEKPDYIVYKVNTYGGELQSAFEIVDLLLSVKQCSTYVFVDKKAISAGALISLACNRMVMGQGTTLGDCAPITQGGEGGIVMLGEKIQSPLRAKFRNLAERNGYPSLLSQTMVTADIGAVAAYPRDTTQSVQFFTVKQWEALATQDKAGFREHKVVLQEGQLLTLTDQEAREYGFSEGSFPDLETFLKARDWKVVKTFATTWSEDLARVLGKFAPLLMLIGFGALYLEFKTPGMSVFGVIGVACLAVAFGSKYAVGLANHTELLLLVAGFLLFAVEIYLFPGTLIIGGVGLIFMIASLTLSFQSFTVPDPKMPWELQDMLHNFALTLGMASLALLVPLAFARYVLPRLPEKARVISSATLKGARSHEQAAVNPGAVGVTKTPLRPVGKALFGDAVIEVASRGEFVESGKTVEVSQIDGQKIIVRPVEDS